MDLIKELKLLDKTIESRRRFSDLLVDNKQLQEVLEIAKNKEMDDDLSEKAISALEFYSRAHLGKLSPYLSDLILIGQNAETSSSKRGIAKIYEAILAEDLKNNNTIKTPELKSISSVCFDWFLEMSPRPLKYLV